MDDASKRIVTSLLDLAEVLTPEQRVQLAERAQSWAEHGPPGAVIGTSEPGGPRMTKAF